MKPILKILKEIKKRQKEERRSIKGDWKSLERWAKKHDWVECKELLDHIQWHEAQEDAFGDMIIDINELLAELEENR